MRLIANTRLTALDLMNEWMNEYLQLPVIYSILYT